MASAGDASRTVRYKKVCLRMGREMGTKESYMEMLIILDNVKMGINMEKGNILIKMDM